MSSRQLSVLSYFTIIGWIISFFSYRNKPEKDGLVAYHLKQGLGLFLLVLIFNILMAIVASIFTSLGFLSYIGYASLVISIFGIINAVNEKEAPLPVIGKFFSNRFNFID